VALCRNVCVHVLSPPLAPVAVAAPPPPPPPSLLISVGTVAWSVVETTEAGAVC